MSRVLYGTYRPHSRRPSIGTARLFGRVVGLSCTVAGRGWYVAFLPPWAAR